MFFLSLVCLSLLSPGTTHPSTIHLQPEPGSVLFGFNKVISLHLTMSEAQFKALAPAGGVTFAPPGFGKPRPPVEGTHRNNFGVDFPWSQGELSYAGSTYKNVGIRYKGNFTFMATGASLKKSFKLDLNKHIEGQKLDGLTMLNLNGGVSDPSRIREALSYAFFQDAGMPAPRAAFAELTLTIPGKYDMEYVGVYTLVEQVNKVFLKHHFHDGKGMLLKPEGLQGGLLHLGTDWKLYEARYRPEGTPTDAQKQRLIDFTRLITHANDEAFAREITTYLDVDAFLKFIATNALMSNLDSYLGFGHNYYLYLVPKTNQFVFIPWDLDLSLATWPAVGTPEQLVRLSILHPHAGQNKLIDRLFTIPQYEEKYLTIIKQLLATSFTKTAWLGRIESMEKVLYEPAAKESQAVSARKEKPVVVGMGLGSGQFGQTMLPRKFIEKRLESIQAQLAGTSPGYVPQPMMFGFGPPAGQSGPSKKN